jgi:Na+-transporting NADH:ubiquinone oxidoreductase subunit NqrA
MTAMNISQAAICPVGVPGTHLSHVTKKAMVWTIAFQEIRLKVYKLKAAFTLST